MSADSNIITSNPGAQRAPEFDASTADLGGLRCFPNVAPHQEGFPDATYRANEGLRNVGDNGLVGAFRMCQMLGLGNSESIPVQSFARLGVPGAQPPALKFD